MEKLIDLHIHTNCSDGALTPKEIIDEAYKMVSILLQYVIMIQQRLIKKEHLIMLKKEY